MKKISTLIIIIMGLLFISHNVIKAGELADSLKGKILLQVESNGEAWYVKPSDSKKIYLKDGDVAYNVMRDLGLGISNADLFKIPIGFEDRFECVDSDGDSLCDKLEEGMGTNPYSNDSDGDSYDDGMEIRNNYNPLGAGILTYDSNLADTLKGKILLQVESRGEAWYINPDDNKRYYMTDGEAAYQIMRYLSLGISNTDLEEIVVESEEVQWCNSSNYNTRICIFVENIGVNIKDLEKCMEDNRFASKVAESAENAQAAGASGTPYSVILYEDLKVVIPGALPYETIQVYLDTMIVEAPGFGGVDVLFSGIHDPSINIIPINDSDWVLGKKDGEISIIEHTDLDCPFCKRFHGTMHQVIDNYPNVEWALRHFPLTQLHPDAVNKAKTAECVGDVGGNDKFWKFVDELSK